MVAGEGGYESSLSFLLYFHPPPLSFPLCICAASSPHSVAGEKVRLARCKDIALTLAIVFDSCWPLACRTYAPLIYSCTLESTQFDPKMKILLTHIGMYTLKTEERDKKKTKESKRLRWACKLGCWKIAQLTVTVLQSLSLKGHNVIRDTIFAFSRLESFYIL